MTAVSNELRKGWCPGALRPMMTGDGLIIRVRPHAGTLSISALQTVAAIAETFGSGEIDLTNRANLQIRGVAECAWQDAVTALGEAKLLDPSAEFESIRNIVTDPVSGLTGADEDIRPLARDIELNLAANPACLGLPAKFGFSCAGRDAPRGWFVGSDINIEIGSERPAVIWLDGAPEIRFDVSGANAAEISVKIAAAFAGLHQTKPSIRRMRDAVTLLGLETLARGAGLTMPHKSQPSGDRRAALQPGPLIRSGRLVGAVAGLPFGRITGEQLLAVCDAALAGQITEVRLSPLRLMVLPSTDNAAVMAVLSAMEQTGLIATADDPRLVMDVCPGAPSCRNATTSTRTDAAQLAEWLKLQSQPWPSIHISGCVKGCARKAEAALTFVAANGAYGAIVNGTVDGAVKRTGLTSTDLPRIVVDYRSGDFA